MSDAESGASLLKWLNGLPEAKRILAEQFACALITKQNLSEWRAGGFAEWQARQEALCDARELAADAGELMAATDGRLTDHLATILAARYARALRRWDGKVTETFRKELRALRGFCQDIVELRRGDHSGARMGMERERLEREREKTEEEVVAQFEQWARNPQVREWVRDTEMSPEEKRRRMRQLFGLAPEPPENSEEATEEAESGPIQEMSQSPSDPVQPSPGESGGPAGTGALSADRTSSEKVSEVVSACQPIVTKRGM